MPTATLLLRENTSASLTSIVEKSQHRKPPLPEYDLRVHSCQLDLILTTPASSAIKSTSSDEGFESDIDSLSIVSSDDSFTTNAIENVSKATTETDSANGSACSDSDETDSTSTKTVKDAPVVSTTTMPTNNNSATTSKCVTAAASSAVHTLTNESYNLVNCICYADVKFPDLLVFVIKKEALVFKFGNMDNLQKFYTTFNTFKAVANQRAYGKNVRTKFNLLHRIDNNGVTHIEISREPHSNIILPDNYEPTSIISINTPDNYIDERILSKMNVKVVFNEFRERKVRDVDTLALQKESVHRDINRHKESKKSVSSENILDSEPAQTSSEVLRKVWNSTDNLLDVPKKPERRRKLKGKAPPPPVEQNQNVLKGEYIRVSVPKFDVTTLEKNNGPKSFSNLGVPTPKLMTYQQFKFSEPKRIVDTATLNRNKLNLESWTSSVPRLLKSQRARGEGRNFTPMAYRYIDTTQMLNNSPVYNRRYATNLQAAPPMASNAQISNRLFGMSSKLKDFGSVQNGGKADNVEMKNEGRWSSLGELSHKINNTDGSLKSVIKKDENKRKNEKKVTFSAYTTVQVV